MNWNEDRLPHLLVMVAIGIARFGGNFCDCDRASDAARLFQLEDQDKPEMDPSFGRLPLTFEMNVGQADKRYHLLAHGAGHDVYLSPAGVSLALHDGLARDAGVLEMTLENGNTQARWEPVAGLTGRMNYFIGPDPARWRTNIPTYAKVRYRSVYAGIDLDYYGSQDRLEHDFIVAPGAEASQIRMRFRGASSIGIAGDGSLDVTVGSRMVRWRKPLIYQDRGPGVRDSIEGGYQLHDGTVGFTVAKFDRRLPLVIDPVVSYSTFLGRNLNEGVFAVTVDASGNAYSAGMTTSPDYATTPGSPASPVAGAGAGDVFVTKLNATGGALVYSARIGGIGQDMAMGIAVDAQGNAYVAGAAESADFPTTAGARQTRYGGRGQGARAFGDCFVLKLNSAGSALVYSTYLGGSGSEMCRGVAVDSGGNAYVGGFTDSTNFPVTENAFQRNFRGGAGQENFQSSDAFLAKINPQGTDLVYSTLVGGAADEWVTAVAVDPSGSVYATGFTSSPTFPVTAAAAQRNYGGGGALRYVAFGDAFVLKMNPEGSALTYSTFAGGRSDDIAYAIAVDAQGSAHITGSTVSLDFPVSANAFQRTNGGVTGLQAGPVAGDAFVVKVNPQGSAFLYSTYLGGGKDDGGLAIALDATGAAYIGGCTTSTNFPLSANAHQASYQGDNQLNSVTAGDAFLTRLDSTGAALSYSTYFGGQGDECALAIAVDSSANVYLAGNTASVNFPSTAGSIQSAFGGAVTGPRFPVGDGFLAKFTDFGGPAASSVSISAIVSAASYAGGGVAPGEITTLTGVSIGPSALTTLALTPANTVATTLSETRVLFDDVPAPLVYVSAGQTSAIVPYEMSGRPMARVVVEYRGARSAAVTVPILAAKPALFSANASGRGPGAIQNEDFTLNTAENASAKGRIVILYGTGEGDTDPTGVNGRLATAVFPKPKLPVSVTIGGRTADVLYAGAAPSLVAGLFQINVKIPEDVQSGSQEVIVTVGAARSQSGLTVAVR